MSAIAPSEPRSLPRATFPARLWEVLRLLLAALLLAYYLLPHTLWSRLSPLGRSTIFDVGCSRPVEVVLSLVLAVGALAFLAWDGRLQGPGARLWTLIWCWVAAVAASVLKWAQDPYVGNNAVLILNSFTIGLIAASLAGSPSRVLAVLLPIVTLQSLYAVYDRAHGLGVIQSGSLMRVSGTFDAPVCLPVLLVVGIPMAMAATRQHGRWPATLGTLAAGALIGTLLLTWDRAASLAIAAAMVWFLVRSGAPKRETVIVALIMFGLASTTFAIRNEGARNHASSMRSDAGRLTVWKRGLTVFERNWAFGVGAGALHVPVTARVGGLTPKDVHVVFVDPKSGYLLWLDEMGLPGGVLLLLFAWAIRRCLRGPTSDTSLAIGAAWIGLAVFGLFDAPFGTSDRLCGNAVFGVLLGATVILGSRAAEAGPTLTGEASREAGVEG